MPNRTFYKNAEARMPTVVCDFPLNRTSFLKDKFTFLNLTLPLTSSVDWNYNSFGKLWTYNLNYFDFLNQKEITKVKGLEFVHDFCHKYDSMKDGIEPFPTSLRIVNWIKFVIRFQIKDETIDKFILKDVNNLCNKLEYQILGNHLLENAFALYFAAKYFNIKKLEATANKILTKELKEQVLADGAHFEKSPMYHNIMLHRVLDCINLGRRQSSASNEIVSILEQSAELMLGWAKQMMFANGDLAKVNDSADGITLTTTSLLDYAKQLGINVKTKKLEDSGYRKFKNTNFELLVDVGTIGPNYIPSHAHSDTLSFVLYVDDEPVIVDPGISTYEKNERRNWERSTAAHNTVQIDDFEQTEVWGGFRVGRRAFPTVITDDAKRLVASHNGYEIIGCTHTRSFEWNATGFEVQDEVKGSSGRRQLARFYFHPSVLPVVSGTTVQAGKLQIDFEAATDVQLKDYEFAQGYNELLPAVCLEVNFKSNLTTKFVKTINN